MAEGSTDIKIGDFQHFLLYLIGIRVENVNNFIDEAIAAYFKVTVMSS